MFCHRFGDHSSISRGGGRTSKKLQRPRREGEMHCSGKCPALRRISRASRFWEGTIRPAPYNPMQPRKEGTEPRQPLLLTTWICYTAWRPSSLSPRRRANVQTLLPPSRKSRPTSTRTVLTTWQLPKSWVAGNTICAEKNLSPPYPISSPFSTLLIQVVHWRHHNVNSIAGVGGRDSSVSCLQIGWIEKSSCGSEPWDNAWDHASLGRRVWCQWLIFWQNLFTKPVTSGFVAIF